MDDNDITRRAVLRLLGTVELLGTLSAALPTRASSQSVARHTDLGSGPTLLAFNREPLGYFEALAQRYRVVVLDYPPREISRGFADSFTADRVCADVLAVADAVAADRFVWFGFSWGAGVGLQLVVRRSG